MVPVAIAGGVGETGDAAEGLAVGSAGGVTAILGDVEGPGLVPGEGAGCLDQGFGGDEFQGEIRIGLETVEGAEGGVWEGGGWNRAKRGGEGSEAGQ